MAAGIQGEECMFQSLSLIFESATVGFSLYHLAHAFLDFTLTLSEPSALNPLLLAKTTHLTNYWCLGVSMIKMTQLKH